jgi:hypothetical protein
MLTTFLNEKLKRQSFPPVTIMAYLTVFVITGLRATFLASGGQGALFEKTAPWPPRKSF